MPAVVKPKWLRCVDSCQVACILSVASVDAGLALVLAATVSYFKAASLVLGAVAKQQQHVLPIPITFGWSRHAHPCHKTSHDVI
jgi:hypothetical protein